MLGDSMVFNMSNQARLWNRVENDQTFLTRNI